MDYDRAYREDRTVFGAEPEDLLVDHVGLLGRDRPVLDVGAGQGRHTIFLAGQGVGVVAIDPAAVAGEQIQAVAHARGLTVETRCCGFDDVDPNERFAGVLLFGLFPDLDRATITRLVQRSTAWCEGGGLLFVTAFHTDDPAYPTHRAEWRAVGPHSFADPSGRVRTYLAPGELAGLYPDFETIDLWEGMGPVHRHGDGPEHRHGLVRAVLRGPRSSRSAP